MPRPIVKVFRVAYEAAAAESTALFRPFDTSCDLSVGGNLAASDATDHCANGGACHLHVHRFKIPYSLGGPELFQCFGHLIRKAFNLSYGVVPVLPSKN